MYLAAGLPVQVRDQALKIHDEIPKSDVGKEYYQQNLEREVTTGRFSLVYVLINADCCTSYRFVFYLPFQYEPQPHHWPRAKYVYLTIYNFI